MEKTDFSFWDNFSCKEYMDYINNIVFKSKYIPENVYEIEKVVSSDGWRQNHQEEMTMLTMMITSV